MPNLQLPFYKLKEKRLNINEILIAVLVGLLLVVLVGHAKAETHFEDTFEAYGDDVKMDSAGDEYTSSCGTSRWHSWDTTTYTGSRSLSGTTWQTGCNDLTIELNTGKTDASTKFYIFFKDTSGVGQNFLFYDFPKAKGCSVNVEDTEISKNTWHEAILTTWLDGEDFWCSLTIGDFYEEAQGTAGMASTTWLYLAIDANCGQNEWIVMDNFQQAIDMPDVEIYHDTVIEAYPNLSAVGETKLTTVRNESFFSFKNTYYVFIEEGEVGGWEQLLDQNLTLATTTYVLYEHTGTTTTQIATSTTYQNVIAQQQGSLSGCTADTACFSYTFSEAESTIFYASSTTAGGVYFVVPTLEFSELSFLGGTSIVIESDNPPTWTKHWILKGDYNILTSEWEFNSPDEQTLYESTDPADYTEGVATTTGEIIVEWGVFGEYISKYLGFLKYREHGIILQIIDVFFNPKAFILKALDQFNIEDKIPFSYIFEIRELIETELENLGTYNASTTAGTMTFDMGSDIGVWEIDIVDIAQAKSDYSTQFTGLRDIIHYSLWLGFVFYIVRKLQVISKGI